MKKVFLLLLFFAIFDSCKKEESKPKTTETNANTEAANQPSAEEKLKQERLKEKLCKGLDESINCFNRNDFKSGDQAKTVNPAECFEQLAQQFKQGEALVTTPEQDQKLPLRMDYIGLCVSNFSTSLKATNFVSIQELNEFIKCSIDNINEMKDILGCE